MFKEPTTPALPEEKNDKSSSDGLPLLQVILRNLKPGDILSFQKRKQEEEIAEKLSHIPPKDLIEIIADVNCNQDIDATTQNQVLSLFSKVYKIDSEQYTTAMIDSLDFNNPENFYRTGKFVELIKNLFLKYYSPIENKLDNEKKDKNIDLRKKLMHILRDGVKEENSGYLLNLKANDLLQMMILFNQNWFMAKCRAMDYFNSDKVRFFIAPDIAAEFIDNKLYIEKENKMIPLGISDIALITKNEQEKPELNKQLLNDYAYISRPTIRTLIENNLKIKIGSVGITEQVYFLQFIKNKTRKELGLISRFTHTFGNDGFRAFLAMEYDRTLGDKILQIGEKLEKADAQKVFVKIAEIIDIVEKENSELEEMLFKDDEKVNITEVKFELLRKVNAIISGFSDNLNKSDAKGVAELLEELQDSEEEIILLASVLKTMKSSGEKFDFENIKNLELNRNEAGKDLPREDKEEILEMARENYFNDIFKDNPPAAESVIADLKEELFSAEGLKNQRAYVLKYQGHIIGFLRFKPQEDGSLYAGSLNLEKEIQGSSIVNYFLKNVLEEEAARADIKAVALVGRSAYYRRLGFEIVGEPFEKNGEKYFNLTLKKRIEASKDSL